jgi:hypothetical protein
MILALVATGAGATLATCDIDAGTRAEFLNMPYQQFDQTHGQGWRIYGEEVDCHRAAADLIIDYVLYSRAPLNADNLRILRWHAGQMLAQAGEEGQALEFFRASYEPPDAPPRQIDWNSYVDATVAFITKDRPALETARARLARQTPFENGYYPNLNVVDGFISCFDRSYAEAYSDACMSDGKTP